MLISETLAAQRKGKFAEEASAALAAVVKACTETGKKGSLTITLSINPTADTVVIKDKIKPNIPEAESLGTTFFADEEGNLTRSNPKQKEMFETLEPPAQAAN